MNDKYFIDTNIFLYAFSTKDTDKQSIAKEIVLQPYYYSEDMQHGHIIEECLTIINPFKGK